MATVYLAHDLKHDRKVALKVLKPELGAVLGAERFLSEIKVTAQLQHPNLLPLFDSGDANGMFYYVMPFVEGETLRHRLDREKQLRVESAVGIAVGVSYALAYAHERGIIHRDLKPENILFQAGQPVVADFGIALAVSNAGGVRATQTGIALGTPQYMSPEQAAGDRQLDARTDIYSLASVLYEMLTGEPPHTAGSVQAVIMKVITDPARPVQELRKSVPPNVAAAVMKALEKLPADRFDTARAFSEALTNPAYGAETGSVAQASAARHGRSRRSRFTSAAITTLATIAAIAAAVGWWRSANRPAPEPIRFKVDTPPGANFSRGGGLRIALSPDSRSLAFATSEGRVFIRHFDSLAPVLIPGPNAQGPELHFSADGKSLAYWDHGPHEIAVGPGDIGAQPAHLLQTNSLGVILSFTSDIIYFVRDTIWSIPASGETDTPRKLVARDKTVDAMWTRPVMLPDNKTIALCVRPRSGGPMRLALLSLADGKRSMLDVPGESVVGYADGMLTFLQAGRLMGVRLEVSRQKVVGEPVGLLPDVALSSSTVTMAPDGTLAYLSENAPASRIEIVDESGAVVTALLDARVNSPAVPSPDGKRIAFSTEDGAQQDIWLYDVATRVMTRLAQGTTGWQPLWTRDGKRIAFLGRGAVWTPADGSGGVEPIPGMSALKNPPSTMALSRDGKYTVAIHLNQVGGTADVSVSAVPLGGGDGIPILQGAQAPQAVDVSPDGRWIAYESRETGRHEVYVRPFPTGSGQVQISPDGGDDPQWSPDGRKLYYRRDTEFRAATLDVSGAMPRAVRMDTLFGKRNHTDDKISTFSVHPDGKHFVVAHPLGDPVSLIVATNWLTQARAKAAMR